MKQDWYVYSPWWGEDRNLRITVDSWFDHADRAGKALVIVGDWPGGAPHKNLAKVPSDGMVYVYGHTDYDSTIFAATSDRQDLKMTADELAGHLADEKKGALSTAHTKLKVFSCYSGRKAQSKDGLAYNLWKALDGKGYKKLTVFGYTQTVVDYQPGGKGHKMAFELKDPDNPDLKDAESKGRASANRVQIAPGGKVTAG